VTGSGAGRPPVVVYAPWTIDPPSPVRRGEGESGTCVEFVQRGEGPRIVEERERREEGAASILEGRRGEENVFWARMLGHQRLWSFS
jgi:hypothetical protein